MKYIKRILIILFLVIMISGCKVDYELKINNDLSVNEKVRVSENTNRLTSRTNLDIKQSVKYLYDIYKTDDMKNKAYSISESGIVTTVTVNNSYSSLDDYSDKFQNDLFSVGVNDPLYLGLVEENDDSILLTINQEDIIDSKATNRYPYDDINISISVPFEIKETNAEEISGNTYKWNVKADKEAKYMFISFYPDKVKDAVSFSFGKKTVHFKYWWIVLVIILSSIVAVISFIYVNNKKNNML